MNGSNDESVFVRHESCDSCGSSDARSLYSDGHSYCFSCGAWTPPDDSVTYEKKPMNTDLIEVDYVSLISRGINEETCKKFSYGVGTYKGKPCQVAPYFKDSQLVAQHLRFKDKSFKWVGDTAKLPLFGQRLWNPSGKQKYLVITEGELDCLSVSQVRGNQWATVSLPNGAKMAHKTIQANYEWVTSFETITLFFDQDDAGREAVEKCCQLLPLGRTKIVSGFPYKDASEALQNNDQKAILSAIFEAKEFSPEGIVDSLSLEGFLGQEDAANAIPYPFDSLNEKTKGFRPEELVVVTAGSGVGKSTFCRELAHHLLEIDQTVGYLALEESVKKTAKELISIHLSKLHYNVTQAELTECYHSWLKHKPLYLFDHFGSLDPDLLLDKVRFLVKAKECQWLFIDHLSILVSGLAGGGEREGIDRIMTELRSFVQETGVGMFLVSHLRKAEGTAHEMGGTISPTDLRGSHGIYQLADMVIGFEANRQSESQVEKHQLIPRVLKNRFCGDVGLCEPLQYDQETGRLKQGSQYGFTEEEKYDDSY